MSVLQCFTHRITMSSPCDLTGLEALFDDGVLRPQEIVAVLGKTEGNGCVNDFSRGYAVTSLRAVLAARLGESPTATQHIPMVMSGGVEGCLSPHLLVFSVRQATVAAGPPALAIGVTGTRRFEPWEIGRAAQIEATAEAVRRAMHDARIAGADDVHLVQVKCPLLTQQKIAAALAQGRDTVTEETYVSMGFSRGASALGVALALGEVGAAQVTEATVCRDHSKWSARASVSAGNELDHCEIIVLGNSRAWAGPDRIAHAVMQDGIDVEALYRVLDTLGLDACRQVSAAARGRIRAVIAKAEASRSGRIRGARHIMWDDSDINPTRHARAMVGGVLAGILGSTELFVSGGAEHQGPEGGGPVAVIAARD